MQPIDHRCNQFRTEHLSFRSNFDANFYPMDEWTKAKSVIVMMEHARWASVLIQMEIKKLMLERPRLFANASVFLGGGEVKCILFGGF